MSKIYKALEKAEREREKELKKDPPLPQSFEETESKDPRSMPVLDREVEMVSDERLVSFFEPGSLASEQFRKLRTFLLKMGHASSIRTIMVTSATNSEGKSFVAANLATGIAHDLHTHALLVDCDLRNPTLGKWFGLDRNKGLSDYLFGNGKVSDLFVKTEVDKLTLLPGGTIQKNPTELIGSKKMEALVQELKSRYQDRYIIFDSTPLLATTEPEVLAKLVDGILFVVRAGVTPRETVRQAIGSLDKEKIIGLVLNDLAFLSSGLSSRYFGSDGYYYKYGYGKFKAPPRRSWRRIFPFVRKS